MNIPSRVRVGSMYYTVQLTETPIVENGVQALGLCDYYQHLILLDGTVSDYQTIQTTFLHELTHAMLFERKMMLEQMGLTYEQMEEVVDNLGIVLHQVIMDNPLIFAQTVEAEDEEQEEEQKPRSKGRRVKLGFEAPKKEI